MKDQTPAGWQRAFNFCSSIALLPVANRTIILRLTEENVYTLKKSGNHMRTLTQAEFHLEAEPIFRQVFV